MTLPITIRYVLAYGLIILLGGFCFALGTVLVAFPVSGCFAWAPPRLRGVVAGTLSGLGGVAAAVAFAYFTFRLILGPNTFGLFPLLAVTVPLIIPIRKKLMSARVYADSVTAMRKSNISADDPLAMAVGVKFQVIGSIVGLVITFVWFLITIGS
jgi:hypothetical protein